MIGSLPADHPEVRRLVSTLAKRSDIPEVILASVQLDVLCGHDLLAAGDIDDDPGHWLAKFNDALADELKRLDPPGQGGGIAATRRVLPILLLPLTPVHPAPPLVHRSALC